MNNKNEDIIDLMNLGLHQLVDVCKEDNTEHNEGKIVQINGIMDCPIHRWVVMHEKGCKNPLVAGTADCPICGKPMCPECMSHEVEQLSRVTGYMSNVGSWNAAKKQEFQDRKRSNLRN